MKIETLAVHADHETDNATGALSPPIHLSTTFERDEDGGYSRGYDYIRNDNPNRSALEKCISVLEGGEAAAAFSSGLAACQSIFQALSPGDHVLLPDDVYHGLRHLAEEISGEWGLRISYADMTNPESVKSAIGNRTRLIWLESPSNPLLKITNIRTITQIAHNAGAICVVDNTWPTPILQRPLELGCDLVVHATTKYLGGHSDVQGGVVVSGTENDFFKRIRHIQKYGGAVPSPFDCWLTIRGIRTLSLRMRAHSENARIIAEFLNGHPAIERVFYPGLPSHPGHEIAMEQMSLAGGMISLLVEGGSNKAQKIAGKVKLFTRATSLGGVESLIEHRASMEGPATRTPDNLLRLSIGIENPDDLIEDLSNALGG